MAAQTSVIFPFVPRQTTCSLLAKPKLHIRRSLVARASSFVATAPPSKLLKNLVAWKLNTSQAPELPIIWP